MAAPQWCFGDFRLDPDNACLWHGAQVMALTPKAFDVLSYLVTHADRLVPQDTLLDAVWPETAVSDAVVRMAISELRRVLGDTAQASRYIATVPRRGYRFVAPVVEQAVAVVAHPAGGPGLSDAPPVETPDTSHQHAVVPRSPALPPPAAERRHLTVLFCDMGGSTALAARLDPEDYRDMVRAYHQLCAEVMQRFDGYVAQYLGDGVLVYFGYPVAHEDDAQRAVRAGLGLLEAWASSSLHPALSPAVQVAVRLGVHTGLVVVGEVGAGTHHEPLALGEAPNIAARLQHLAEPNTLALSAATQQLVAGYFRCKALGAYTLPGLVQPLEVYRVLGPSGAQSRLEVAAAHGLTPLVGRDQEVSFLTACWTRVTEGLGQVVLLKGEAGIGKSRLGQVLKAHVTDADHLWLEGQGSPYHQHTALYPLPALLTRLLLSMEPAMTPAQQVQRLEAFLGQQGLAPAETVPLFAPLLSLPIPATYTPVPVSPEQQRQQTLHALLRLVLHLAAAQPLLLVMEDLHWADPSTLEWLSLLVDQGPTTRILTLCTCRPDFTPPWIGRSHCTQMTLARLPERQATELTQQVAQGTALPTEVVAQIVAKTDGVPLFVEEVTKTVLESRLLQEQADHSALTRSLPPLTIPATLHDALLARLDRLGTAKGLAQFGATLGREFSYALLQTVSPWDEETVRRELQQLVVAELLYQRGLPPQATYVFKHALIQEAAYQSLLKRTRQQYHQHIAQVLEAQFPDIVETQPELLAHHYTEAGVAEQALPYWQRAGERAIQRSAHAEAIAHLRQGLDLLKLLPDTPEHSQQELILQSTLGPVLISTRGYAAPDVASAYARARDLCRRLGDSPHLFLAVRGLQLFHTVRAELQMASELAEELLLLAQRQHDPMLLVFAHLALGIIRFHSGAFVQARVHLEQGIALDVPSLKYTHSLLYGNDAVMVCISWVALTLWLLGYPDQAQQRGHEALTRSRHLAQPFSLAFALTWAAWLHQLRREPHATQAQAEAAMALGTEQGFVQLLAFGRLLQGWALAARRQGEDGIAHIHQGLHAYQATGAAVGRPQYLALLAEAQGQVGQTEAGLAVLTEALTVVGQTGERSYEAEIHRLTGQLLLAHSGAHHTEAEACFRQALDVACRQQTKSLELRAATRLAQLWQQQGKRAEARALLAPIYGWFTEGFDTADLQEANALLEELT